MATTSINALSYLASTTVATYADLNGATTASNLILALSKSDSKAGFTQEQANEFAKKYTILDQLPNVPYNGFSAALFEDNSTPGKHIIAMRGTEVPVFPQQTWLDLVVTDGLSIGGNGFANNQAVEMFRYYKRLVTPSGQAVQYSEQEKWQLFAIKNSLLVPATLVVPELSPILASTFQVFKQELAIDKAM